MTYVKEREYIVAYDNEGKYAGKWNILTGEFYGLRKTVVKKAPSAFSATHIANALILGEAHDRTYARAIDLYNAYCSYDVHVKPWTYYSNKLEQIISVGLRTDSHLKLAFDFKLNKDIIQYIQKHFDGWFNQTNYHTAVIDLQHREYLKDKPYEFRKAFRDAILAYQLPVDFVKTFLHRCELEHIIATCREVFNLDLSKFVYYYYLMCNEMYGSVKVEPNLLSNYAHINVLYKQYQNNNRDEILKRKNDLDWLYFSNGEYQAVPLITAADFHKEAEAQRNCIERIYMEKVMFGQTHVVAVRKVGDPEHSVVTCEVDNQGIIIQYLGFANSRDLTAGQAIFKEQYARHLSNNVK